MRAVGKGGAPGARQLKFDNGFPTADENAMAEFSTGEI